MDCDGTGSAVKRAFVRRDGNQEGGSIKTTASHSSDVIVFCFVAKTRSFSEAAKQLGISRSLVSKRVTRLEERLDTRLIQRSTRSMSLTEAGELLYQRYSDINDRLDRAEREVADLHRTHSGLIRFAAPMVCAHVGVALISSLQRLYPNIEVELTVDDGPLDVIKSGYDAAIHIGSLRDSNLICRKISRTRLAVCASPGYLIKRGLPATTRDLKRHNCLIQTPEAGDEVAWRFRDNAGKAYAVPVTGDFQANSDIILLRACLAGMGLCQLPMVLIKEYIDAGELEVVLADVCHVSSDVYVVLPHRDMPEKVRVAVDFLTEQVHKRFPLSLPDETEVETEAVAV